VRSEAIAAVFLQRRSEAKRVYATVVHSKLNTDGYKSESMFHPSTEGQMDLLEKFYKEIDVDPSTFDFGFIETHGTGTIAGDPIECEVIDKIFSAGRENPLLIGSTKSNLGHTEG
jgi:fatty acid synthase, animal type